MAIKQVEVIAPEQQVVTQKGRKGWGKPGSMVGAAVGGVLGGLAGAAGTTLTGGAAAPIVGTAAIGGTVAGASLGNMIGERIRPGREEKTAMERRQQSYAQPQVIQNENTQKLKDSIMALTTQSDDVKAKYSQPLLQAYVKSLQDDHAKKQGTV